MAGDFLEIFIEFNNYHGKTKVYSISFNNEKPIIIDKAGLKFNLLSSALKYKKWSEIKTITLELDYKNEFPSRNTLVLVKTDNENIPIEQPLIFNEQQAIKIKTPEIYCFQIRRKNITMEKYYKNIFITRKKFSNINKITSLANVYVIPDKEIFDLKTNKSELLDSIIDDKIKYLIKTNQELPNYFLDQLKFLHQESSTTNKLNYINHGLYEKEIISKEKKIYDFESQRFIDSYEPNTDEGLMIPYHFYGDYNGHFAFNYKVNDKKWVSLKLNFSDKVEKPLLHPDFGIIKTKLNAKTETYYPPFEENAYRFHVSNEELLDITTLKNRLKTVDLNRYLND